VNRLAVAAVGVMEFGIFYSHPSVFQVTSSIISSLNATPVVYYRYQFVVSISFITFRIKKFACAWYWVQWATIGFFLSPAWNCMLPFNQYSRGSA